MSDTFKAEAPRLLTIADIVRLSGLCESTIRKEINAGRLPKRYFGRSVRILREDFEAWATGSRRRRK